MLHNRVVHILTLSRPVEDPVRCKLGMILLSQLDSSRHEGVRNEKCENKKGLVTGLLLAVCRMVDIDVRGRG